MPFVDLPPELPVMTLPDAVLFPHTITPLYIFESRYRKMLAETLSNGRLFVLAKAMGNRSQAEREQPCSIATAGIIRLSSMNPDGTSTIALQGAQRVRIQRMTQSFPYPKVRICAEIDAAEPFAEEERRRQRDQLFKLIMEINTLGCHQSEEFVNTCRQLDSLSSLTYFALQAYCDDPDMKQRFLETLSPRELTARALRFFEKQLATCQLKNDLCQRFPKDNGPVN